MLDILKMVTFMWLAFWAVHAIIHIVRGNYQSILFVIIVHFFLTGLPLALDIFIGQPRYLRQPGFKLAAQDIWTNIIYCFYVGAVPLFWWLFGRYKHALIIDRANPLQEHNLNLLRRWIWVFHLLLFAPLIVLFLFAPDPSLYLDYAWFIGESYDADITSFHSIIALLCVLSIVSATIIISISTRINLLTFIYLLPWIVIAIWLHGKRDIIVMTLALFILSIHYRGIIRKFDIVIVSSITIVILLIFSSFYQSTIRNVLNNDFLQQYENFRIDYGRDDVIKMTIFAELYPERMKILEFRGQSLLFYLTMYIPRDAWPDKPFPYATYFTNAMLQIYPPRLLGWGMTTSWLEEAIANFSWAGFILGPLLPALICRIGDRRQNIFISCFTILISIRFLMVAFVAFAPLFWLWLFITTRYQPVRSNNQELSVHEPHHHSRTPLPDDA